MEHSLVGPSVAVATVCSHTFESENSPNNSQLLGYFEKYPGCFWISMILRKTSKGKNINRILTGNLENFSIDFYIFKWTIHGLFFCVFVFSIHYQLLNVADGWIWTHVLWCWKLPLCHHDCLVQLVIKC